PPSDRRPRRARARELDRGARASLPRRGLPPVVRVRARGDRRGLLLDRRTRRRPLPGKMAVDILLALGVVLELLCCVCVVVMRTTYDRLHYAAAGTTVPAFLILAAVLVKQHLSAGGLDAI